MTDDERARVRAVVNNLNKLSFAVAHAISEFEAMADPDMQPEEAIDLCALRRAHRLGRRWSEPRRRASVVAEEDAPPDLREMAQANDAEENVATADVWSGAGGSCDFGEATRASDEYVRSDWRDDRGDS